MDFNAQGQGSMVEGFADAEIGIVQFDILAYQSHGDARFGAPHFADQALPRRPVGGAAGAQAKPFEQVIARPQALQDEGYFVEHVGSYHRDNGAMFYVAELGDLGPQVFINGMVGAGNDHIR